MRVVILATEDDFEGWRAAARGLAAACIPADQVMWQVGDGPADLFAEETVIPDLDAATLLVPRYFANLAGYAILHRDPERFSLLYALLLRLLDNPNLLKDRADRQLRRVEDLFHAIRRDIHKMRAFVRFRELEVGQERRFVSWFEPEHHIVRANAKFFVDRFTGMAWSILTPQACIHWNGTTLTEGPGATRGDVPAGDPVEAIWKRYFASIFNPARLNPDAMMKEMPKKVLEEHA